MLVSETTQRDFYVEYYTHVGSPLKITVKDGAVTEGDAKLRAPIRAPLSKYYFFRAVQADDERCASYWHPCIDDVRRQYKRFVNVILVFVFC